MNDILVVSREPNGRMRVSCDVGAFTTAYSTGMQLAMMGRVILEALRMEVKGSRAMMEQAQAEMTDGFVKDMQLPDDPSKVKRIKQ